MTKSMVIVLSSLKAKSKFRDVEDDEDYCVDEYFSQFFCDEDEGKSQEVREI